MVDMRMHGLLIVLLLGSSIGAAHAQRLIDPLRPQYLEVAEQTQDQRPLEQRREDFNLTAVLTASDRSVVIINGQILQLGQQINGYQLTNISAEQVILKNDKDQLILRRASADLMKSSPKTP